MNEKELRISLNENNKEELIDFVVKLRKMLDKSTERLHRVEEELLEKTSLEELINGLSDDTTHEVTYQSVAIQKLKNIGLDECSIGEIMELLTGDYFPSVFSDFNGSTDSWLTKIEVPMVQIERE
jgi:uncharacterized coiled-coil protein SlyX